VLERGFGFISMEDVLGPRPVEEIFLASGRRERLSFGMDTFFSPSAN